MNITSCDNCGVVLDLDKIAMPSLFDEETGSVTDTAVWDGDKYVPTIPCPVCNTRMEVKE